MSEEVSTELMNAMGIASLGLGLNAVVQNMPKSQYPVLFIVSLAAGCALGTLLKLDERLKKLTKQKEGDRSVAQGIITGCLLFCIGTLSILGPVQSALYGDNTYLFTNASLDFVGSMVLAATYGIGMALAAIILVLWQGSIYCLTLLAGNIITGPMMTEISIVGGLLIAMSGINLLNLKQLPTVNYLPSLFIPVLWCLLRG